MQYRVADVLGEREARPVVYATPDMPVRKVARLMTESGIGAVVVMAGDDLCGMFTERDLMTRVVDKRLDPGLVTVDQVMTPDPVTVTRDTTITEAMILVSQRHLRHLPVMEDGVLVAMLSARDLLRSILRRQQEQLAGINRAAKALARHPLLWGASPIPRS
ncbi:MAG: CBS domain-containing protein [Alphaproteobacteria bacterium]|jgi:CBS domain-containing protein|nr:CBS domain-containing protein [Alphaproteobacteria bacterium]